MHLARYNPLVSTTASHRSPPDRRLLSREFIYHQAGLDSVGEAFIQHEDKYYQPISILPTISKIIERSAHVQLCSYLEENKLLSQSQFGFPQKRSTSTALITFTDQILESMDKGYVTGAVFLDLRKAFDTVDHVLLINKLKGLGVAGKSLAWFRSYLSGRTQQKMCENELSPPAKITVGVPQGNILGPLLFLVYINGIQSVLKHSRMTMFADDLAFYCHENSPTDL